MSRKSWVVISPRSRSMTSSSSGVRVAAGPVAAEVDEEEKEAKVLVERYVLGSVCKVLAGTPALLGATPLVGGVNFIIYSC
jgi:isoamylase